MSYSDRKSYFKPNERRHQSNNNEKAPKEQWVASTADNFGVKGALLDGRSRGEGHYLPRNRNMHFNPHLTSGRTQVTVTDIPKKKYGLYAECSSAGRGYGVPEVQENNFQPTCNFQPTYNFRSSNIERPQLKFEDKIDNSNTIWVPRISFKPNALKPLELKVEETDYGLAYSHPYEFELDMFAPLDTQLCYCEPIMPLGLDETTCVFVDKPYQLVPLVNDLLTQDAIAIDLEHHSFRSFQGFTCLMQISTHSTDYLIDTLALRSQLHVLNYVFTNPYTVKVFHGARFDILWLQRDLSLYVVNMFDTYFAAKTLQFSQLSLSFLLYHFCQIDSNKGFQMADWRIRPLSKELENYAREDTHYLLYIYARLRNALLDAASGHPSLLESVYKSSTEICRRRYYKNILTEKSHLELTRRSKTVFTARQLTVLKEIYRWRDELARQEDESTGYVLPNHMLLRICEFLPEDTQSLAACCSPLTPLLESRLMDIHKIIVNSKESEGSAA